MFGKPSNQYIGQDIQPLYKVELLEDHRALPSPLTKRPALERCHINRTKMDRPFRRIDQAVHQSKQRRLACTGRTDDTDKLTRRNVEGYAVYGLGGTEAAAKCIESKAVRFHVVILPAICNGGLSFG